MLDFTPGGSEAHDAEGSRTFVSTRVIAAALRRLLQGAPTHASERIHLEDEDDHLVCAYGVSLRDLADRLRDDVLAELTSLIGAGHALTRAMTAAMIAVEIADLVDSDPNVV